MKCWISFCQIFCGPYFYILLVSDKTR